MKDRQDYLYAKDAEKLQIPFEEYSALLEETEKAAKLSEVRDRVAADLQRFLSGGSSIEAGVEGEEPAAPESEFPVEPDSPEEPVAVEVSEDPAEQEVPAESVTPVSGESEVIEDAASSEPEESSEAQSAATVRADMGEVPPIKQEIAEHFNTCDESGRLFNIFKQYYTCLNEACGGTVRVTMKDGFCSLWNYDEWEEFAWIDIYEDLLRISIAPRYTDALKSLSLCEAPRLISSRRNVICVQVGDLNNTVLDVLAKAFSEVGIQVG